MSLDVSGFSEEIIGAHVTVAIDSQHPLIKLANRLPWGEMLELIRHDLEQTEKKCWFRGRPLRVRVHLGVYLLQKQFDLTDRHTERLVRDNAAFRLFCGLNNVNRFHVPDHTKIEAFRSRLQPETQHKLANMIVQQASRLGYANPRELDIDSTPQNANITYPSRAKMLLKIVKMAKTLINPLVTLCGRKKSDYPVCPSYFNRLAMRYYLARSKRKEDESDRLLKRLWSDSLQAVNPILKDCYLLLKPNIQRRLGRMASRIRSRIETLRWRGMSLLERMHSHLFDGKNEQDHSEKIMASLHAREVACINKNKLNKSKYYGRVYQLGRVGGNFLMVQPCESLRMPDARSMKGMIHEHQRCFGASTLESLSADTGYYSHENYIFLDVMGVNEIGLQRPRRKLKAPPRKNDNETLMRLYCRRSGIEALIGHAKHGGQLEKSRMKSDSTTLSAGYASVLGFNLRQMSRHASGLVRPKNGKNRKNHLKRDCNEQMFYEQVMEAS